MLKPAVVGNIVRIGPTPETEVPTLMQTRREPHAAAGSAQPACSPMAFGRLAVCPSQTAPLGGHSA